MNRKDFKPVLWLMIGCLIVFAWINADNGGQQGHLDSPVYTIQELHYSDFLRKVEAGDVLSATITGDLVSGRTVSGAYYRTRILRHDPMLVERLLQGEVDVRVEDMTPNPWTALLLSFLPWLVFIGAILWIFSRGSRSGKGLFSVGKSRARLITPKQARVTFKDVAGIDEAREDLVEIVDYLRNPQKFMEIGGKIPKGILLVGPPGTGKTLTAKAVAGEAGVPFYTVSGSDFVEMFVGVGASRVRDMFAQARKSAPCIVFIDEIDAIGRRRDGGGVGGANDEREQTLNQLLVEMDGFEDFGGVIIIGATNRPDVLDPALLRPGRFDRQVIVSNPDLKGREQILRVHMSKVNLAPDVDSSIIARGTPGFSGAELANLVNEAALLAARRDRKSISMKEFEDAKDKILMGSERNMIMTEEERRLTAYHEAGHALVGIHVEGNDPLHKVTIIPRGRALGVTMSLPERDRIGYTRKEILAKMAMMFGGRAAEEIVFGEENITTGASNDIQQASNLARRMVCEWGMSEKVGPLDYAEARESNFLGVPGLKNSSLSEETAREIDLEVKALIQDAEQKAKNVLREHMDQLHKLSKELLEREALSRQEVEELLGLGKATSSEALGKEKARPESGLGW